MPVDGSKARSKEIHAKARKIGIGPNTVQNYLNMLVAEGSVIQIAERPKEVYYSRCEGVRIQHLIDDFMKEIDISLSRLPDEVRSIQKKVKEGSVGEVAVEFLATDQSFLRSLIINTLVQKVYGMLKATLPTPLKDKDFYIGVFGQGIRLVPRSTVERETSTEMHSAKS